MRDTGTEPDVPVSILSRDDVLSREGASFMVFHSPHAGQRPIHLDVSLPHAVQYHAVLDLAAMDDAYSVNGMSTALTEYSAWPSVRVLNVLISTSLNAAKLSSVIIPASGARVSPSRLEKSS